MLPIKAIIISHKIILDKNPWNNIGVTALKITTKEGKKQYPIKDNGPTPLQNAAYQGHLQICHQKVWRIRTQKTTMEVLHFTMLPMEATSKLHKTLSIGNIADENPKNNT